MRYLIGLAAMLLALTMTAAGWAGSDIPDLKGAWTMHCSGIAHEKPSKSPPPQIHAEKSEGRHDFEMRLVIERQDGFCFSGFRESSRKKEKVIGVIGFDNQAVYLVGDGGIEFARLVTPDKMEAVYLRVTEHHSIAARAVITRKR